MPLGDRIRRRGRRRRIRDGDTYTRDEEERGEIELDQPDPIRDPPDEEVRGEPWGWTKPGPRPRGWPGPEHPHTEPGPYDGSWDPPSDRPGEAR